MENNYKRFLSLLLALAMVLGMMPVGHAHATGGVTYAVDTTVPDEHHHTAGDAVTENEVAATCTTDGSYDSVVYCTGCGEEISRETKTIPANGHVWDEGVYTEPTCEENGCTTYTCTVEGCGATEKVINEGTMLKAVAELHGVKYATLEEAVAISGAITLLSDYEITESIRIDGGHQVIIDLNGYTLTGPDDGNENQAAFIVERGHFQLEDHSKSKSGKLYAKCCGVVVMGDPTNLFRMNGGTITATENTTEGIAVVNYGGKVDINVAALSGAKYAIFTGGLYDDATTTISKNATINGVIGIADYGGEYTEMVKYQLNTGEIEDGYEWVKHEGYYDLVLEGYEARERDTYFWTFEEAIMSHSGGTVDLLVDHELQESIVFSEYYYMTLDLNGYKLTAPDDGPAFILEDGYLLLRDSSDEKTGELYAKGNGIETRDSVHSSSSTTAAGSPPALLPLSTTAAASPSPATPPSPARSTVSTPSASSRMPRLRSRQARSRASSAWATMARRTPRRSRATTTTTRPNWASSGSVKAAIMS